MLKRICLKIGYTKMWYCIIIFLWQKRRYTWSSNTPKSYKVGSYPQYLGMDQYLLIPFLVGWTSIYQLFWCELQGYKVLTHCHLQYPLLLVKLNSSLLKSPGFLSQNRPNNLVKSSAKTWVSTRVPRHGNQLPCPGITGLNCFGILYIYTLYLNKNVYVVYVGYTLKKFVCIYIYTYVSICTVNIVCVSSKYIVGVYTYIYRYRVYL